MFLGYGIFCELSSSQTFEYSQAGKSEHWNWWRRTSIGKIKTSVAWSGQIEEKQHDTELNFHKSQRIKVYFENLSACV